MKNNRCRNMYSPLFPFIQGHYSYILDSFIDFNVNFHSFTVGDAIDFVCYSCLICNGTSNLAEITRVTMGEKKQVLKQTFNGPLGKNMYQYLCYVSKNYAAKEKSVGSCSEPRHTPCSHRSPNDWDERRDAVLSLIKRYFFNIRAVDREPNVLSRCCKDFISEVIADKIQFPNVSTFLAVQFLQVLSLVGLVPLGCYNYAEPSDVKLGSSNFIQLAMKKRNLKKDMCSSAFEKLMKDIEEVWDDGKVSRAIVENVLCELSRSYWLTVRQIVDPDKKQRMKAIRNWHSSKLPDVTCLKDENLRVESKVIDVLYFLSHRKTTQSFFKLRYSGDGANASKPQLVMVNHSVSQGRNVPKVKKLTNWKKDVNDQKQMQWSNRGTNMIMSSSLTIKRDIQKIYKSK